MTLVKSIVSTQAFSSPTQSATLDSVAQGNLIPVVGTYNIVPGSVIIVSDSLGNTYTVNQPLSDTHGSSYWFAYAVAQSTGTLTITITYSVSVTASSFTLMEFFDDLGWVNPPAQDGLSFLSGNGTSLSSDPLTTTTSDDLIIALSHASGGSIVMSSWTFISQQSASQATWWMESTSEGLITPFAATQTVSGNWNVSIWALQANLFNPNSLSVLTSSVSPTAFIEVYPNRIKEDIYDSLEGQPQFVYIRYGPSLLNG